MNRIHIVSAVSKLTGNANFYRSEWVEKEIFVSFARKWIDLQKVAGKWREVLFTLVLQSKDIMVTLNKEDKLVFETVVEIAICVSKGGKIVIGKNESILKIDRSDSHWMNVCGKLNAMDGKTNDWCTSSMTTDDDDVGLSLSWHVQVFVKKSMKTMAPSSQPFDYSIWNNRISNLMQYGNVNAYGMWSMMTFFPSFMNEWQVRSVDKHMEMSWL